MLAPLALLPLALLTLVYASPVERRFDSTITLKGDQPTVVTTDGTLDHALVKRELIRTFSKYFDDDKARAYSYTKRGIKKQTKSKTATVDLYNPAQDQLYPGAVTIGTPPQTLPVLFDTGSADVWVSSNCGSEGSYGCFASGNSTSFHNQSRGVALTYVTGAFEGYLASDTVSGGGLTVKNQNFAVVPHPELTEEPFVGIIGLAFSISKLGKPTFLDNLIKAGELYNNMFSFYFTRDGALRGSELTLGGTDSTKYIGGFTRAPVVSESHWTIMTSEFAVDRKLAKKLDVATVVETGSSVSYMPKSAVEAIYAAIPGAYAVEIANSTITVNGVAHEPSRYEFPCDTASRIGFVFGGTTHKKVFDLDPRDLNLGVVNADKGICAGNLLGIDFEMGGMKMGLLGIAFLKSWVSLFNLGTGNYDASIGFARSI